MSKSLVPNPDKAQGVIDEAKSQGTAFVAGAVTVAALVPVFGWIFGPIVGVVGYASYRLLRKRS